VKEVMNLQVPQNVGNFLTGCQALKKHSVPNGKSDSWVKGKDDRGPI
jgi:hypothetical protein